ncbi:hypothetical protein HK096_002187 [Nowakowskiella sp. JEL0078]|nr:hypothetical protein HK096_002187 [Nowakowskiella sp. JEL0078]
MDGFSRFTTNTVILAGLPPIAFANDCETIRSILAQYGKIVRTTVLKTFARFLAVYESQQDAMKAKFVLHNSIIFGTKIGAYFGTNTDTNHLNPNEGMSFSLLQIPKTEKNFLISPPGSPPVGWVQSLEATPSSGGHHEILIKALESLNQDSFSLDDDMMDESPDSVSHEDMIGGVEEIEITSQGTTRKIITFRMPMNSNVQLLPKIIVENVDMEDDNSETRVYAPISQSHLQTKTSLPSVIPSFSMDLVDDEEDHSYTSLPRTPRPPIWT